MREMSDKRWGIGGTMVTTQLSREPNERGATESQEAVELRIRGTTGNLISCLGRARLSGDKTTNQQ